MVFFYLWFLTMPNDTGFLKEVRGKGSFKFAHLADINSAELSNLEMELTNAIIPGATVFFFFIFNEHKKDPKFFPQKTTTGDLPENSGSLIRLNQSKTELPSVLISN